MTRPRSSTLLALTGALHLAIVAVIANRVLLSVWSQGAAGQPVHMAVLWSMVSGVAMLAVAAAWRVLEERADEPLPASFAAWLAVMGLMVVVPMPVSGAWLLFPQAGLILRRASRHVPGAVRRELHDWVASADVVDVKTVRSAAPLNAFTAAMLGYQPAWMTALYAVRMAFVRLLGMRQAGLPVAPAFTAETLPVTPGERAGFFRVHRATPDAWSCQVDDTHLWAGLAVVRDGDALQVVTVVRYKKWTGPVYFNVIRPFHHVVVRSMIRAGLRA